VPTTAESVALSRTLVGADLPGVTGDYLENRWQAVLWTSFYSLGSGTLYVRLVRNGVSQAYGTRAVGASGYWGRIAAHTGLVVAGDTVELRVWASAAGVAELRERAIHVVASPKLSARFAELFLRATATSSAFTGTPYGWDTITPHGWAHDDMVDTATGNKLTGMIKPSIGPDQAPAISTDPGLASGQYWGQVVYHAQARWAEV
jgi:hypothetical protein